MIAAMGFPLLIGGAAIVCARIIHQEHTSWALERISHLGRIPNAYDPSLSSPTKGSRAATDDAFTYTYDDRALGTSVDVYVLDSGVSRHTDFGGPNGGSRVVWDTTADMTCRRSPSRACSVDDDQGHGTAIAGVIASTTYGVAKEARLVPVKVFGGGGRSRVSWVVGGGEWVVGRVRGRQKPAVIHLSSMGLLHSPAVLTTFDRAAIHNNIHVVVAAGDDNQNACHLTPHTSKHLTTVAGTTIRDTWFQNNNYGACVDLLAPAKSVNTLWPGVDGESLRTVASGTSIGGGLVAGVVAGWLGLDGFGGTRTVVMRKWLRKHAEYNAIRGVPDPDSTDSDGSSSIGSSSSRRYWDDDTTPNALVIAIIPPTHTHHRTTSLPIDIPESSPTMDIHDIVW
ncbi:hypothetical protein PYCC9005_001334 [Savitreella phatthalungensis]